MRNMIICLAFILVATTSGCLRPGGYRSAAGSSYTPPAYASSYSSGGYGIGPGTRVVRGAAAPVGGSSLHGSGYLSPEAVATADTAYQSWVYAPVPTGATAVLPVPRCTGDDCPMPVDETAPVVVVDPEARARLDMLEDSLILHAAGAD